MSMSFLKFLYVLGYDSSFSVSHLRSRCWLATVVLAYDAGSSYIPYYIYSLGN